MRRRRRARGTWFPTPGTEANDSILSAGLSSAIIVPATGAVVTGVFPLTFDEPTEGGDVGLGTPLVSILGDEYFLRRIVGKFNGYINPTGTVGSDIAQSTPAVLCTAGFFVARAGDFQDGNALPIGGHLTRDYSPDQPNTIREPWIWRRQWLLADAFQAKEQARGGGWVSAHQFAAALPFSTAEYGSVLDGPHIDAKTRRRVSSDDRLWFAVDCKNFPLGAAFNIGVTFRFHLDYRIFGSLRKARNRGVF